MKHWQNLIFGSVGLSLITCTVLVTVWHRTLVLHIEKFDSAVTASLAQWQSLRIGNMDPLLFSKNLFIADQFLWIGVRIALALAYMCLIVSWLSVRWARKTR